MDIYKSAEFEGWYGSSSVREKAQVDARITRIEVFNHFGEARDLGDGLAELKWKNGRRVYLTRIGQNMVLLLHGGHKNAQKKDIKKARLLLEKYADTSP